MKNLQFSSAAMLCLFLFLILVSPQYQGVRTGGIEVGPYLQNVTDTAITIMWKTDAETSSNAVVWGTSLTLGNTTTGDEGGIWHEVRIAGLEPSTSYFYRVRSDGAESAIHSFRTSVGNGESFSFVAYGDSRGVWDDWHHASLVARGIANESPLFVIHTGDMVNQGLNEEAWLSFLQISEFMHNATLFPAMGNHDLPASSFTSHFSLPGNERWYAFTCGDVHFIVLDSVMPDALSLGQFIWLMQQLHTDAQWIVAAFHHPPYSSGEHGNTTLLRFLWSPFLERGGVDLVLTGHDHIYEHIYVHDTTYIVTGGGGAPLYDVGESPWTVMAASAYHYVRIDVGESTMRATACMYDGEPLEQFDVPPNGGMAVYRALASFVAHGY